MNYLEIIKNKFIEMNFLERILTLFLINFIVFFMFSSHCFVFTRYMFKLLSLVSLGGAILGVLLIDMFFDRKNRVYKKFGVAVNIMAIVTVVNTIFQQLNINLTNIFETLNLNDRFFDINNLFNFKGTGSLISIIYENFALIFSVVLIVTFVALLFVSDNEKHLSLVHKFRSFFNSFKQLLTEKNENYGFLYKRIP